MSNQKNKVIIFTAPPSKITNIIGVSDTNFVSLINGDNQNIIFKFINPKSKDNFCFYIVKEGFCFRTNGSPLEDFQQYSDTVKLASEKGFDYLEFYFHSQILEIENAKDYNDFLLSDFYSQDYNHDYDSGYDNDYDSDNIRVNDGFSLYKGRYKEFAEARSKGFINRKDYHYAIELGIQNHVFFKEFIDSGYTGTSRGIREMKRDYKIFLKAKEKGFLDKEDYELAEELGIKNYQELEAFMQSGFYGSDNYYNTDKYEEFKEAKGLGFDTKSSYDKGMNLGLDNYDAYKNFLESGCKTVEEYQFKIIFPPILTQKTNKIREILNDSSIAFDSMSYEEFFRLKYLSVEKMAEIAYMKIFKKELNKDNELKFDDIINELDKKTESKLVDLEELRFWRRLRNKIIHDHFKLDKDKTIKGKEFLDELYNKLNEL